MGKSKTVPLAKGLIGGKINSIHGQLELFLDDHDIIKIVFTRKPYGGQSDVKFSIAYADLQDIIDILYEAKEKLDEHWLSKYAVEEIGRKV